MRVVYRRVEESVMVEFPHVHANDSGQAQHTQGQSPRGQGQGLAALPAPCLQGNHRDTGQEGGDEGGGGQVDWYLVDAHNKRCHLPKTMLFLGRDECDIIIQSGSVDKRHAVITFDLYLNRFKVKDLSTTNGTYVNESRIPEQEYVTLNHMDSIRLGYDSKVYHMEQGLPTDDSPPPPPLPAMPPPPLNMELEETELPEPPAWLTRDVAHEPHMAECQGCIAEQKIEHTCTHAGQHAAGDHPHFVDVDGSSHSDLQASAEPESLPDPDPEPEFEQQQQPKLGRNTWPRKKVRQVAHVASIFDADDDSAVDDGSGLGPIMVESGSNYFVSLDDSVCDSRRNLNVDYTAVQRIPRNSKFPLPPELETVKKGTPLYGQPAWWGDDDDDTAPAAGDVSMDKHSQDSRRAIAMEIPHGSTTPERDKRDKSATPARSVTSSISKDSLVLSPADTAREKSIGKESAGSGEGGSSNPSLSFTVEFGDEKKPRMNMGGSLSEYVPPKIRNSLASHARLEKTFPPRGQGKESSSSAKNSEERELSPNRQKKLDELWGAETAKGKSKRQSSGQATGVASLKTADFSSDSLSAADKSKKDLEKKSREAEKELEKKGQKPSEGRKSSPRAATTATTTTTATKTHSKSKQSTAATIAASVHPAQYSDPTAYLIDKMFAGATGTSMDSPRSVSSDRSDSPTAPEHIMYKEAAEHDKAISHRGSLTYRAHDGKPSPGKHKSSSRSPAGKTEKTTAKSQEKTAAKTPEKMASRTPEKLASNSQEKTAAPAAASKKLPLGLQSSLENSQDQDDDTVPVKLPVVPSPAGGDQDDAEDKVSEAGTYTIEADKDDSEEMKARQQIDEVFGVDVENFPFERPVIGSVEQLAPPEEEEADRTLHEDDDAEGGCRTPCDENDEEVFDMEDEEEGTMSASNGAVADDTVPAWISQLNALSQKASTASKPQADSMAAKTEGESSKKHGLSRRRPGTGRKLPSIPNLDNSPVSSEHSSFVNDNSLDSPATVATAGSNGFTASHLENGHSTSGGDRSKGVSFSPVLSAPSDVLGKSKLGKGDSPVESEDSSRLTGRAGLKNGSARSQGSIDTEILLRDTETVMAAMEARMGFRTEKGGDDDNASDTDLSSMVAMVNGDDDYVKPTKYHSPRESLSRKSTKDKDNSNIKLASRKPLVRSKSEQKPPIHGERSTGSTRSGAGVSVVSDVLSRNDSLDESFQSDVSSERGDTSFNRSGSRGKGTITMTKPNRAFALRRARADGTEVTEASQTRRNSGASLASSQASSRRSSSVHSTGRAPYSDRPSGRSDASLGAQIAKKAKDNAGAAHTPSSRGSPMTRADSGRHSLRGSGRITTPSSTASSASASVASAKKDRDLRTLKSQLKTAPGNKDLAITGISSKSQSQPGSRSNSPKAAERMAWKRRKEYDPRKAVAEAKAKAKEPKPKPKAHSSLYKQRMIRSASFTNSVELSGRTRHDTYSVDSTSSAEDLSSAATASDSYTEAGFRRAFIPFHNPLRGDRLSHSADEDEAGTFPTSQDVISSISSKTSSQPPVSLTLKSAFTPPLSKLHTPSPESPPHLGASLLLRRRTLGAVDCDDIGASTGGASSHRTQSDGSQSYDTLIVSSIYQLSLKLKTATDKTINKLREQDRVSITPSPIDDFLGHSAKSEIPAWKSANQELAGVLKNLRKMEHHLHVMERALFPDEETDLDVSGMSSRERHKYFQEIERIRSELAGFQPIDTPRTAESQDPGSPEMAELGQDFC